MASMDSWADSIFKHELRDNIGISMRAWRDADTSLRAHETAAFWAQVHVFLHSSIAVVNILWPSANTSRTKKRAARLRKQLSVGDNPPPGLRELRNSFEHFDERVDRWADQREQDRAQGNYVAIFVDYFIGDPVMAFDLEPSDVARHYNPVTGRPYVYQDSVDIGDVLESLAAVHRALPKVAYH